MDDAARAGDAALHEVGRVAAGVHTRSGRGGRGRRSRGCGRRRRVVVIAIVISVVVTIISVIVAIVVTVVVAACIVADRRRSSWRSIVQKSARSLWHHE